LPIATLSAIGDFPEAPNLDEAAEQAVAAGFPVFVAIVAADSPEWMPAASNRTRPPTD